VHFLRSPEQASPPAEAEMNRLINSRSGGALLITLMFWGILALSRPASNLHVAFMDAVTVVNAINV